MIFSASSNVDISYLRQLQATERLSGGRVVVQWWSGGGRRQWCSLIARAATTAIKKCRGDDRSVRRRWSTPESSVHR
ncbi:hypothetical protein L2E82_10564 [Cichorium intybus]|uniref:Uncharacterized protein n=1 Tax=Cichorium intybus TaxID=13427 RepID=A0ACB9GBX1_CICIN|nr:hypothetical protein L2E82_10564 [Cichorium intybus]